jgi:malonate transporter
MLTSLLVIWPVFAIIGAGFACGRMRLLGPTAASELNRFVVYLALPALLFDVMAEAHWSTLWQPGFVASFAIGSLAIFGCTLAYRASRGHHLTDASIDALNAGYANVGYIGFPLCDVVFGRQSFALVTIAAILTLTVLFAVAIIFVEIGCSPNGALISWRSPWGRR